MKPSRPGASPQRRRLTATERERLLTELDRSGLSAAAFTAYGTSSHLHHALPLAASAGPGKIRRLRRGRVRVPARGRTAGHRVWLARALAPQFTGASGAGRHPAQTLPGSMLSFHAHRKVFLATAPCDRRASFTGLWAAAEQQLGEDPKSGALFVFRQPAPQSDQDSVLRRNGRLHLDETPGGGR